MATLHSRRRSSRIGGMNFSSFPAQWVALIISLVAVLMAVPGLLQRKYGAPKIVITFDEEESENYRYLGCAIYNRPILQGLLRRLGVRREMAQDVVASFAISEQGTNRVICPESNTKIKTQQGVAWDRIELPASVIPARIVVVNFDREGKVVVCKEFKEQAKVLASGAYTASIRVLSGDKVHKVEHGFVVSDSHPFAKWRSY